MDEPVIDARCGTVVAYCQQKLEYRLFVRMRPGLLHRRWKLVIVTHLLSVWWRAWLAGIPCRLTTSAPVGWEPQIPTNGISQEVSQGLITPQKARVFQLAVWHALDAVVAKNHNCAIAIFGDTRLAGRSSAEFAKARGVATLFFELGNLEKCLFVDPQGTNAASQISQNPALLDRYVVPQAEFDAWREVFIARRLASGDPPQAKWIWLPNLWFPLDRLGATVGRIPQPWRVNTFAKIAEEVALLRRKPLPSVKPQGRYILLPLQVSADANVIMHSDYDNLAAVVFAAKRAAEAGCQLVVKPHPAERDVELIAAIARLCREQGHLLTAYNVTELILGAEEVVTINSTVGLEALILDRPTTVLGRSLYRKFTRQQAIAYVLRYLLDFDPFGSENASLAVIDRLVSMFAQDRASAGQPVGDDGVKRWDEALGKA